MTRKSVFVTFLPDSTGQDNKDLFYCDEVDVLTPGHIVLKDEKNKKYIIIPSQNVRTVTVVDMEDE